MDVMWLVVWVPALTSPQRWTVIWNHKQYKSFPPLCCSLSGYHSNSNKTRTYSNQVELCKNQNRPDRKGCSTRGWWRWFGKDIWRGRLSIKWLTHATHRTEYTSCSLWMKGLCWASLCRAQPPIPLSHELCHLCSAHSNFPLVDLCNVISCATLFHLPTYCLSEL